MKNCGAGLNPELIANLETSWIFRQCDNIGRMNFSTLANIFSNIEHIEDRREAFWFGYERTDSGYPPQYAFAGKFVQRALSGGLADSIRYHELIFGRHTVVWRPFSGTDAGKNKLFNVLVGS